MNINPYVVPILLLLLFGCDSKDETKPHSNEFIVGVKIYEHSGKFDQLFENFKDAGVNAVFASVELLSNEEFKQQAKLGGFQTFVILPIFHAPDILHKDSSLYAITQNGGPAVKEWLKFVCPSDEEYRQNKISYIQEFVEKHHPDAISLDFIRHFAYWEKVYPDATPELIPNTCFDDRCISKFVKDKGVTIPQGTYKEKEIYDWIIKNHFEDWVQWKSELITSMVKEIVTTVKVNNPEIIVNLHAVPWRENDFDGAIRKVVGQDFESLTQHVDYISPMTYSHMVKREPAWINSVVKDIQNVSGSAILPSIQVGIAYLSDTLSSEEFEDCLLESIKAPSKGVVFWNWDALFAEKEKLRIVKNQFN
jgi:hypothetical protein